MLELVNGTKLRESVDGFHAVYYEDGVPMFMTSAKANRIEAAWYVGILRKMINNFLIPNIGDKLDEETFIAPVFGLTLRSCS